MKWIPGKMSNGRISPWYVGSDDFMYSISKSVVPVSVSATGFRYAAHRIGQDKVLGYFDDSKSAMQCCEDDANGRAK